ncbi:hypothetical protein [Azospirillum sp. SYSU D00513]|uniref:hypothetical protein n=1 Tax=Azospirillum sp. SYSU D00513 TaxID=2812561 RepID=UPI001A97272B|nr:hypothetical protein [Azospirillum sp. SYSU D00513]
MSRGHDGGRGDGPGDDRGTRDYDAMQRDIRTSQERITETLGALERKLSRLAPRHLKEQMMERMHTNPGGRTAHSSTSHFDAGHDDSSHGGYGSRAKGGMASIGDTMRSHPVPLAMIGIGLGWLALTGSGYDRKLARSGAVRSVRGRVGDATGYARQAFSSAGEHVSDAVGSATQRVRGSSSSSHGAGQTTGMYAGGAQSSRSTAMSGQRAKGMASSFWDMVEDHPLVAGVMGLTLGAALGASIPSTRYENEWIGDYADEATERAKSMAHDYVDRGTRAARAALETAQEELGDAMGTARNAASEAVQAAKEEASKPS